MSPTDRETTPAEERRAVLLAPASESTVRRYGSHAWMWLGIILLAAVVYVGISAIAEFVIPLVVAIVLGMVFVPAVDFLARSMNRAVASIIVLLGVTAAIIASVILVIVGIIDQGPEIVRQFRQAFAQFAEWLSGFGIDIGPTSDLERRLSATVGDAIPALLEYVPSVIDVATGLIAGSFVALFILYFVLADWEEITNWFGSRLDVPADLGAGIAQDATRSFREYFYVLTASSIPVAVIIGIAAAIMSVPLAFTIALVTLVTSYIPYIGALISSIFAVLIAFGSGGLAPAVIIVVVIIVAQGVVQPLIQTKMQRDTLDIHPIVGFGATVVGSVLVGILGATLAAPVAAMLFRIRDRIAAYEAGDDPRAATAPGADGDVAPAEDGTP